MIAAATLRRRLQQGDTYADLGAELGISADAMRKRANRLGVKATAVLGWHRGRPIQSAAEQAAQSEKARQRVRAWRAARG